MKYPTPYQRILRAFEKSRGVRLSADEVAHLICFDDAIRSAAENDDEDEDEQLLNTKGTVNG